MNYLLDTHVYIWWSENSSKLKPEFKSAISNPKNKICISIVSLWEIAIKIAIKKLRLKDSIEKLSTLYDFEMLPLKTSHLLALLKLPLLHKDPFDRMLVAQAKSEKLKLLSNDPQVKQYFSQ